MNKPIILAYHSINDQRSDSLSVSTKNFRWQIEYYLKRGYKTITLEDYALKKYSDNQKILIITFLNLRAILTKQKPTIILEIHI